VPVYKTFESLLNVNFTYTNEHFDHFPAAFGTNVQGLALGLNWSKLIGDRKVLTFIGQFGLYSDMNNISGNAMRGLIGFDYLVVYSQSLAIGFGAAYVRQLYGNQLLPIIAVKYKFNNEHWKLNGILPTNPKLSYTISEASAISLEIKQHYSSYRLSGSNNYGDYIKNKRLTCMLNYEFIFAKAWRLSSGLGFRFHQSYSVYANESNNKWYILGHQIGGSAVKPINSITHGGAQFHIGIAFNPF
jgi:hypothetical protein